MIVAVVDQSQVAVARRAAAAAARACGVDDSVEGRVGLIATEMATTLLKHGSGGEVIVERFADDSGAGIELLALDRGRGIADIGRAIEDGYSTAGSAGTGLGAIRRQADQFEIFSLPGAGTAVMARIDLTASKPRARGSAGHVVLGAVVACHPGETACGDSWSFAAAPQPMVLLLDGSGHGPLAAAAAELGVATFEANREHEVVRLMEALHRALAPTRGAAGAIARVDHGARTVRFVGIGNVMATAITHDAVKKMVSHHGTLGHVAPRIREFTYPFDGRVTVVLHSDGISAKWDMERYPGLASRHPSLIAATLFRDYRRMNDDASIVVLRFDP